MNPFAKFHIWHRWLPALLILSLLPLLPVFVHAESPTTADQPAANDLTAYPALEVTQGVQTYKPSGNVPLVAGKRTMVFFYARLLTGSDQNTTAELTAEHNGKKIKLLPLNAGGYLKMIPYLPDRYTGERQFRFELPAGYRDGTVSLTAVLNPDKKHPVESDYTNNTGSKTVSFEVVPPLSLSLYDVGYRIIGHGKHTYSLADIEADGVRSQRGQMVDWLQSAYPIQTIYWKKSSVYMGWKIKYKSGNINMLCTTVNLAVLWGVNHDSHPSGPNTHGYGMVTDNGAYMRGCAELVSDKVASGPTWIYNNNPATSGGDDYGGHELGHIFGREHPNKSVDACDEGLIDSGPYPYKHGVLSPLTEAYVNLAQDWGEAVLGVDVYSNMQNPRLYTQLNSNPAHDLMTYCDNRWVSDFSSKKMMSYFQSHFSPVEAAAPPPVNAPMDRFVILGVIDAATQAVMLEPIYVLPDQEEATTHQAGDYAIVLRNTSGGELLRYPFSPTVPSYIDPGTYREQNKVLSPEESASQITQPRYIYEAVPWMAGTARIDIVGPDGALLHTLHPGAGVPTVTLLTPNGGTRIQPTQRELEVNWNASDPDGDPLTFSVEYSADNGKNWVRYSDSITETTIALPEDVFGASNEALVRVSASDGVNTGRDTSDSVFTVINHPPTIQLLTIDSSLLDSNGEHVYASGQTVALQASAYDVDEGSLDEKIVWLSDKDGNVGSGPVLSSASLTTGTHTLIAQVQDRQGLTASVEAKVIIVPTLDDLPAVPDQLIANPAEVNLSSYRAFTDTTIFISNLNINHTISWTASVDASWVQLGNATGATDGNLIVSRPPNSILEEGTYTATITLTSTNLSGVKLEIPVAADIVLKEVYLPMVRR